jgi:dicarboxylate transporter 10
MISGAIGGVVGNPADVTNVRMQNDRALPIEKQRNYRNAFDGIIRITRDEGVRALFRGLGPNMLRGVLMTASQVVSYDRIKVILVGGLGLDGKKRSTHFTASLLAGLVATTTCSPVDVIKTRIMNSTKNRGSAFKTLVDCVKHEGILFAFRGWVPAFVRLGPQTIVTFLVLEQLKASGLGQKKAQQASSIMAAI